MKNYEEDESDSYIQKLRKSSERTRIVTTGVVSLVVFVGFLTLFYFSVSFNPDANTAVLVLQRAGFSDVRVVESGMITFRCSSGDTYYYRVKVKNPNGDPTEVTVCCGLLKDCTIRY